MPNFASIWTSYTFFSLRLIPSAVGLWTLLVRFTINVSHTLYCFMCILCLDWFFLYKTSVACEGNFCFFHRFPFLSFPTCILGQIKITLLCTICALLCYDAHCHLFFSADILYSWPFFFIRLSSSAITVFQTSVRLNVLVILCMCVINFRGYFTAWLLLQIVKFMLSSHVEYMFVISMAMKLLGLKMEYSTRLLEGFSSWYNFFSYASSGLYSAMDIIGKAKCGNCSSPLCVWMNKSAMVCFSKQGFLWSPITLFLMLMLL